MNLAISTNSTFIRYPVAIFFMNGFPLLPPNSTFYSFNFISEAGYSENLDSHLFPPAVVHKTLLFQHLQQNL